MWRSQYRGQEIAAKAVRVYLKDDFGKIRRVSCWRCPPFFMRVNGSRVSPTEVLQGGSDVECSSSSKRATIVRRDDDKHSVRDGVGVDGEG